MKMYKLFTACYGDNRTEYEKTLNWIYENQGNTSVIIKPSIWLWKSDDGSSYFVDYVSKSVGCTLGAFQTLAEAMSYRERLSSMEREEFRMMLIKN